MGKYQGPDARGGNLFEVIYKENFPAIYRFGYRLLGNSEQALDMAQEVFLKLYRRLNDGSSINEIKGWLYRTATNLSYDWLRRKSRFQKLWAGHHERIGKDVEKELINAEAIETTQKALEHLPPRDQVLLMLYQDELSYEEISRATGLRKSSLGTFISRAIKRLVRELEKGEKS
jgi:RNA polymerase sigma-70 factor (ECF subfamily)